MANIRIKPSQLSGTVKAPPSKSDAHRAIICAALSRGKCRISPIALSDDIKATIGCVRALGAKAELDGDVLTVDGSGIFSVKKATLDCFESGSTLRFFVPIAAAAGIETKFVGRGRLPERPIGVYLDCLPRAGVLCETEGGLPLEIYGRLRSGNFEISGNISSQFITGLLFALPLLGDDSRIVLTTELQSAGYIDMTIACMAKFGVEVEKTDYGFFVKGSQKYSPCDYTVEGDWSQAAFFLAAGALSGDVFVEGLEPCSTQGDKKIAELLLRFGAKIKFEENGIRVQKSPLRAIQINAGQIPDLVPVLAVAASQAEGETEIFGAGRLRIKESDRLTTTANMLRAVGAEVEEKSDGLVIRGKKNLRGGKVDGSRDHRIVMAASVLGLCCNSEVEISDMESISKSFPNYFEEYKKLGGVCECLTQDEE